MLEQKQEVDLKKRSFLRKAVIGGAVVGAGLIGASAIAGASPSAFWRDEEGNLTDLKGGSATDEKVKYDAGDTTAGYVADKVIAGEGISVAEGTGADENKLVITNDDKGSDVDLTPYAKLDGTNMPFTGIITNYNPAIPDMGVEQTSDLRGYGLDYVTEKSLTFCKIGYNDLELIGNIRYYNGELQVYRGQWDTLLSGVAIVTDETEIPLDVELTDFDVTLSLITGDSDELDFNGEPLVQQMHMPMGCYASHQVLRGGEF